MEKVYQILDQLNLNSSIFTQFAIVVVLYLIAKFVFFNQLKHVIELRIQKTSKTEDSANELVEKFETLKEVYEKKIDTTYKEIQETKNTEKKSIDSQLAQVYKKNEEEVNDYVEKSKAEVVSELSKQRDVVLSKTDEFANQLIEKIKA